MDIRCPRTIIFPLQYCKRHKISFHHLLVPPTLYSQQSCQSYILKYWSVTIIYLLGNLQQLPISQRIKTNKQKVLMACKALNNLFLPSALTSSPTKSPLAKLPSLSLLKHTRHTNIVPSAWYALGHSQHD